MIERADANTDRIKVLDLREKASVVTNKGYLLNGVKKGDIHLDMAQAEQGKSDACDHFGRCRTNGV